MSVELAVAVAGCELSVAEVHVRSWQAAYRGLIPDSYLDGLKAEDRAARYTFGRSGPDDPVTVVARSGGSVCGFATIGPARDDGLGPEVGELWAIYVDPAWWGRKVGRDLIAWSTQALRRRGWSAAVLWVLSGNERARTFYERDGWAPDGTESEFEVAGHRVPEVRYRRQL